MSLGRRDSVKATPICCRNAKTSSSKQRSASYLRPPVLHQLGHAEGCGHRAAAHDGGPSQGLPERHGPCGQENVE